METPVPSDASESGSPSPSPMSFRHDLYERFGPAQVGVSADGREVHFMAPVESGLGVGGFAVFDPIDDHDDPVVIQVRRLDVVEREGPELTVSADLDAPGVTISSITARPRLRSVAGAGTVLGTLADGRVTPRDQVTPFGERLVRHADAEEIAAVVDGLSPSAATFEIGHHHRTDDVPARLVTKGFSRHTFVCGQSGSGKTYTTGALFERLLAETTLPIVVLDPNSDHVHLDRMRLPDDPSDRAARFRAVSASVRVARARGAGGSVMLCADFSDLALELQALVLRLHPVRDAQEFEALGQITATLAAPYSIHDVVAAADEAAERNAVATAVVRRIRNLEIEAWDIWRGDDESSIAAAGLRDERCVVLDLGSLTRPDERTVVALAVLGNRWRQRAERRPVLLAIDEAHNVVPAVTDDPLVQATTDLGTLIAGEGRKYGLHLFVATQRPAKVHPNVVSQCDNLVLMRMNGTADIDDLVATFSHVPEAMIRAASRFGLGQALFAGPIAPVPMFAHVGTRLSPEGGGDVATDWATPPSEPNASSA